MTVNRIGSYGSYMNAYTRPEIKPVSADEIKLQEQKDDKSLRQMKQESLNRQDSKSLNTAPRTANLEDISLNFNKNETYDYIGRDAGLDNLDMMSAISDMQKDKVLEQYQYFVKPREDANSIIASTADGVVVQK